MKYKKCKACNQKKPLSEFHYSGRGLYQRVNRCKEPRPRDWVKAWAVVCIM